MNRQIHKNYKVQIDWRKVAHVRALVDKDTISLDLKPSNDPLPRVMIITVVTDPILFQFSVYSWMSMVYPRELLNWVVLDSKQLLSQDQFGSTLSDKRVRVVKVKGANYNDTIKAVMDMDFITVETEKDSLINNRPLYYMSMECGDIMFPDTLSIKFRALGKDYDCVMPDTLAYYDPVQNTSIAWKLFMKFPRNGLYWKKNWWGSQSSNKINGIPYIGNCVTIGKPTILAIPQKASVRFFDNFPTDVKDMVRKIVVYYLQSKAMNFDSDDDSEDLKED